MRVRPRRDVVALSMLRLDAASTLPLRRQLLLRLRDAIVARELVAGARLPSTRAAAGALGVARNTVADVFAQLIAEGYLVARPGSGTFVADVVPVSAPAPARAAWERASLRGRLLAGDDVRRRRTAIEPIAFQPGVPALEVFPFETWARLAGKIVRRSSREQLGYGDAAGYGPLRDAIAAELRTQKDIACSRDQVIVVSGTQQALDLIGRLMLDPGDDVWIEDPASHGTRTSLRGAGANLVAVPVDDEGLDVDEGCRRSPNARLAYVTSGHQWPLGPALSLARRHALLAWAAQADAWVVEDEYDSVIDLDGTALPRLATLDRERRVIWVGTFSISLFPALRLGYLVAPPGLVDAFTAAKVVADRQTATLEQAILAEFMYDGGYVRHLARMREVYAERRAQLVTALEAHVGIAPHVAGSGLHVVLPLGADVDDTAVAAAAARVAVTAPALSDFYLGRPRRGLVLGFGAVQRAAIVRAARALGTVVAG
jgi:GntR family transcriptional regulator/MocR family aminotransferase